MEVKIGVQNSARELTLESAQTQAEVQQSVRDAIADATGVLSLKDEKGRMVIVPVSSIAYVEIAEADVRRVGFSVSS